MRVLNQSLDITGTICGVKCLDRKQEARFRKRTEARIMLFVNKIIYKLLMFYLNIVLTVNNVLTSLAKSFTNNILAKQSYLFSKGNDNPRY